MKVNKKNHELSLVIGEDIIGNILEEFNFVSLYVRDENGDLHLYANIKLPYLMNYLEIINFEDDPRYFLSEGYNPDTTECINRYQIKPFGSLKGVYLILRG